MKIVRFQLLGERYQHTGVLHGNEVLSIPPADRWGIPARKQAGLLWPLPVLPQIEHMLSDPKDGGVTFALSRIRLLSPVFQPRSIRDFYAFEAHVKNARARRGLDTIPEWYQFPVFYFTNPNAIYGPGDEIPKPRKTHMLDFELEVAVVIGKEGRDITADQADEYIAGM